MALREVIAKLGYDLDKGSEARVKRSLGDTMKMAAGLAAAFGAAAFAGLNQVIQQTAELGDEIAKTARQIGVDAQALQELRFAAELTGSSTEGLTVGLRRLQAAAKEAADGSKSFVEDFERVGVQVRDSNGQLKSAEVLLAEVADGMVKVESSTERVALAQTLMGRSGTKLIPLLLEGSEGLKKYTDRARELGGVFEKELLAQSEDYLDAQTELGFAVQGLRNILANQFMPVWTTVVRGAADLVAQYRGPLRRAVETIFRAMSLFGRALDFVVDKLRVILPALGVTAALLFPIPALLLAAAAAAILVAEDLEVMAEGGESAIGRLIDAFKKWSAETLGVSDETFGKIWEWLKIIGEAVVFAFVDPLSKIPDLIDIIIGPLKDLVGLFEKLGALEASFSYQSAEAERSLRSLGERVDEAVFGALLGRGAAPPAAAPGGGTSVVSRPTMTVDVTVQGSASPEATGQAVADQVQAAFEGMARQAANAITVAAGG